MPRIASSKVVLPKIMNEADRSRLADELADLYAEVYDGATRDDVLRTIFETKSEFTTVLVHRSDEGTVVGYFAIHFHERLFRGVQTVVIRSSVATRRAYRGNNSNITWAMGVLLNYWLAHPGRPIYGMGAMAHPSSYLHVVRYVDEFWPRPNEPVPPDILAFMHELGDEFQMRMIDPDRPLVRYARLITKETEVERNYWLHCDKPAARFFVSANPTYGQGNGLLTLFPISATMLGHLAARIAREGAQKKLEGVLARAMQLPFGERFLRPSQVRRHLRASALFANLDDASLDALVERAEPVSMPAGTDVFREGDLGRDIYLVARGAVYVLDDSSDAAFIDQLGTGSLFGEIAALSDGRRTASVRTAIPSVLVRIPGDAVRSVMVGSDAIRGAMWSAFAARIFDDYVRATGSFPGLDRAARQAWIRRAQHVDFEPGAVIDAQGAPFVVVLNGAVRPERGAGDAATQAPAVLKVDVASPLVVSTAARVALVPPLARVAAI
jgi:CRP-like cAMP-binding protein